MPLRAYASRAVRTIPAGTPSRFRPDGSDVVTAYAPEYMYSL